MKDSLADMSNIDLKPEERIIVALDYPNFGMAFSNVLKLKGRIKTFKVGPVLFLSKNSNGLQQLIDQDVDIFLDLKFHDIPTTVEKTIEHVVGYGIKMFTIHAFGGIDMMQAVAKKITQETKRQKKVKPLVLAVTVLTSHDEESLSNLGITRTVRTQVLRMAEMADKAGVDGIVCSGHEVKYIRKEFGKRFLLVVPGIRPGKRTQDQKRTVSAKEAVENGADYLVIGRPITESRNPDSVIDHVIKDIT